MLDWNTPSIALYDSLGARPQSEWIRYRLTGAELQALADGAPAPNAMRSPIAIVDVDRPDSWTRYRAGLCASCAANCCTMPLEVQLSDLVRLGLVDAFEAEHEEPKRIAKRLQKARLIDHFNHKHLLFTLARRADGDCQYLEAKTPAVHGVRATPRDLPPAPAEEKPQAGLVPLRPQGIAAGPR